VGSYPRALHLQTHGRSCVCVRACAIGLSCGAEVSLTNAAYDVTLSGLPAAGTCLPGFGPGAVPPSRTCLVTGVWSADNGGCVRTWPPQAS
jgi:hypothetical protein